MFQINALPPYTDEELATRVLELQQLRKEIGKSIQISAFVNGLSILHTADREIIKIALKLNLLNDLVGDTKFALLYTDRMSTISETSAREGTNKIILGRIGELYSKGFIETIKDKPEVKPLPGLEEIISKDLKTKVTAFQRHNNIVVTSWKRLNLKHILMILRLQYTLLSEKYSTPMEDYPKFLDALLNDDLKAVNEHMNNLLNSEALEEFNANNIGGIFKFNREEKIRNVKRRIENLRRDIADLERTYLCKHNDLDEELENLETVMKNKDSLDIKAIGKYFINHPYIYKCAKEADDHLVLTYRAPLINLNEEAALDAITYRDDFAKKIVKVMLDHCDKFTLYTECNIRLYSYLHIEALTHSVRYDQFIGQPHIDNHACYGNHIDYINQFAKEQNIIGVVDQMTEMVMNMNFKDGIVTDNLIGALSNYKELKTWKNNETGEFVNTYTVMEAIYGEA